MTRLEELADWLASRRKEHFESIAANDPHVKAHIAWLHECEAELRGRLSFGDLQIQQLYEALKAAAYYIERLELVRSKANDVTEAMEYYRRVGPPLIAAYEKASA